MKLVIATGIYPPEVGGPAHYAVGLKGALERQGHMVAVVTYGGLKSLPTGLRHVLYACKLFPSVIGASAVIALDTFSVAVPSALVCSMLHVRLVIRTGGDFLWEEYVERTGDALPLPLFYDKHKPFTSRENLILKLTKYALHRATVVFSTEMQRDLWLSPYDLKRERTRIIGNAIESSLPSEGPEAKNFLWHVRSNAIKNAERVRRAFAEAQKRNPDITLEDGTLPKDELLKRMKSCYAVILPSLTEISPNYILDALRFKKPFIMDKYSGMAKELGQFGDLVDPLNVDDIATAISRLATSEGYAEAVRKVSAFNKTHTYDDIAKEFLTLT